MEKPKISLIFIFQKWRKKKKVLLGGLRQMPLSEITTATKKSYFPSKHPSGTGK